jgi:hypothetical protein
MVPDTPVPCVEPGEFWYAHTHCPGGAKLLGEAWKERFHDALTTHEQDMGMTPLRHPFAGLRIARQHVPFDERHTLEVICKATGGEKTSHTPAGDHSVMKGVGGHRWVPDDRMKLAEPLDRAQN